MTDPIVKKLTQRIADKVAKNNPNVEGGNKFNDLLKTKQDDMLAKIKDQLVDNKGQDMQVMSADDIEIRVADSEMGTKVSPSSPFEKGYDLFTALNKDFLSLDATIEVLADPGTKLSRKQLLAYQAGIGNLTVNAEMYTKLAQSTTQTINQFMNMQV